MTRGGRNAAARGAESLRDPGAPCGRGSSRVQALEVESAPKVPTRGPRMRVKVQCRGTVPGASVIHVTAWPLECISAFVTGRPSYWNMRTAAV